MTNRKTIHDGEKFRQSPAASRFIGFNGYDSCRTAAGNHPATGGGYHVG
jgi:hypothetical protein